MVDRADLLCLDVLHLVVDAADLWQTGLQRFPSPLRPFSHHLPLVADFLDYTVKIPPLLTLDHYGLGGLVLMNDLGLFDPDEISAVQIAVPLFDFDSMVHRRA